MKLIKMSEVCQFFSGGTPSKANVEFWTGKTPWFSPKDIKSFELIDSQDHISQEAIDNSAAQRFERGSILVVVRSGVLAHSLPVGILRCDGAFNQDIKGIIPRSGFDPEFVALFLKANEKHILREGVKIGATVHSVKAGFIEGLNIPDIPVKSQLRIAAQLKAQLAEVEKAHKAVNKQIEEHDRLVKAIYRQAFHNIVPISVPPSFGESPNRWSWHKLSEVARLESGHTPSRFRPDWWNGDVSWISLTEIRQFDGKWTNETILKTNEEGIANSAARILPVGTVCYSRTASVGFVTIMAKPMATSQDFANWVCGEKLDSDFLMYALICSRKELRDLATGATHKTIYMPTLREFHICAPNIQEQQRIVIELKKQLSEIEKVKLAIATKSSEIESLPNRILSHAFEIN